MKKDCTVLVSSCDAYEDLWYPFFTILKKEWPELSYPIVLNTESKEYSLEGLEITTFHLFEERNVSWTRRLRETLQLIESTYIIFMLDDFFLQSRVLDNEINKCLQYMSENKNVSCFCFMETPGKNIDDGKYEGFELRPTISKYKFNCQAGLWRRKHLIEYLSQDESPWEWEEYGNWRSYRKPSRKFYSHKLGSDYVFPYLFSANGLKWGGLGLYRGKWYLPYVQPLFDKHGISVNYSIRGIIDECDFAPKKPKNKEDYYGIMRFLFWLRPIYGRVIPFISNLKYLKHFF